jgi:hypothetical protein
MRFQRFMSADDFLKEIEPLRAFRGEYVGTGLLESLESTGLLVPKLRLRYPDSVARRLWLDFHNERPRVMTLPVEPDGELWDAAVELKNALYRWQNQSVYGRSQHPLDDPGPRFAQFIEASRPFQQWIDTRVEVSNDLEPELFDSGNIDTLYTTWQVLLTAEVADAGVHYRINLADKDVAMAAHQAVFEGKALEGPASLKLLPVHAARGFAAYERALDAVVWFAEECHLALNDILKDHRGGRWRLTDQQSREYYEARRQLAHSAAARYAITLDHLVALAKFLSERWADWNHEGRSRIADVYRSFLAETVHIARLIGNLTFADVRDRVGQAGGWFKPILDIIWPDWGEKERERVKRTLQSRERPTGASEEEIDAFVRFLSEHGLEAFFWRLNSFEHHAFRGNAYALEGMKSDIQGMAIAVEHVAEALGATATQLYEKFKQLWCTAEVLSLLRRGDVAMLARQARLAEDWPRLKARIDALRAESGGEIAADLVMAHRIRGGVHTGLPEDDQFELEAQFVGLMRAALRTFIEVQRAQHDRNLASGQTEAV